MQILGMLLVDTTQCIRSVMPCARDVNATHVPLNFIGPNKGFSRYFFDKKARLG